MTSYEVVPPDPVMHQRIELSELHEVSQQLWDTPDYGNTAVDILTLLASDRAQALLYKKSKGFEVRLRDSRPVFIQEPEEALDIVRQTHPDLPYILSLLPVIEETPKQQRKLTHKILPDGLSTIGIGEFLQHRGLVNHNFHGAVGKAFDVLGVISETRQTRDVGASHVDIPFVNASEVAELTQNFPFEVRFRMDFLPRIEYALRQHLVKGMAGKFGEVILEGRVTIGETHSTTSYQKIAQQSLAVLPDNCSLTSKSAIFLRDRFAPQPEQ